MRFKLPLTKQQETNETVEYLTWVELRKPFILGVVALLIFLFKDEATVGDSYKIAKVFIHNLIRDLEHDENEGEDVEMELQAIEPEDM